MTPSIITKQTLHAEKKARDARMAVGSRSDAGYQTPRDIASAQKRQEARDEALRAAMRREAETALFKKAAERFLRVVTLAEGSESGVARPTISFIQKVVAAHSGIPVNRILGLQRDKHTVYARHLAQYLCKEFTPLPVAEIGRRFHRDHASVLSALNRIKRILSSEEEHISCQSVARSKVVTDLEETRATIREFILGSVDNYIEPTQDRQSNAVMETTKEFVALGDVANGIVARLTPKQVA